MKRGRKLVGVVAVLGVAVLGACGPLKTPTKPPPPGGGGGGGGGRQLLPPPPDSPAPPNSPNLQVDTTFLTGLDHPWDIAFRPGDVSAYFYTQRSGPVRVHVIGDAVPDRLIVTPPDVAPSGESGMLGLAVDPNFDANRFIYTCYTATNDNRVVRWQVNNTLNGIVGSGTVI